MLQPVQILISVGNSTAVTKRNLYFPNYVPFLNMKISEHKFERSGEIFALKPITLVRLFMAGNIVAGKNNGG